MATNKIAELQGEKQEFRKKLNVQLQQLQNHLKKLESESDSNPAQRAHIAKLEELEMQIISRLTADAQVEVRGLTPKHSGIPLSQNIGMPKIEKNMNWDQAQVHRAREITKIHNHERVEAGEAREVLQRILDHHGFCETNLSPTTTAGIIQHCTGEELSKEDCFGNTILHWMCEKMQKDGLKTLVERIVKKEGLKLTVQGAWGKSALHVALEHSRYDVSRTLVTNGADVAATDNNGMTPLHALCQVARLRHPKTSDRPKTLSPTDVAKLLLDRAESRLPKDKYGLSAVHYAIKHGHHELIEYFMSSASGIRESILQYPQGQTPVQSPVQSPVQTPVQSPVQTPEKSPAQTVVQTVRSDLSYLHYAILQHKLFNKTSAELTAGEEEMETEESGEASHDIPGGTDRKRKPQMDTRGSQKRSKLEAGVRKKKKKKIPETPVRSRHLRVIEELILAGVHLDLPDDARMTPLHYAVCCDLEDVTNLLIDKGADRSLKDENDKTPAALYKDLGGKSTEMFEKLQPDS